jgi:hypothetical protein
MPGGNPVMELLVFGNRPRLPVTMVAPVFVIAAGNDAKGSCGTQINLGEHLARELFEDYKKIEIK